MDQPEADHILQVGLGFWASKTLLSAVEMGLFTELAKHPADLETLQGRLGLHQRSSRDFFDALVALKFLERHDGRYYNTPSTDFLLRQTQALVHRRYSGNGQPSPLSILEPPHDGAPNRTSAKRN